MTQNPRDILIMINHEAETTQVEGWVKLGAFRVRVRVRFRVSGAVGSLPLSLSVCLSL